MGHLFLKSLPQGRQHSMFRDFGISPRSLWGSRGTSVQPLNLTLLLPKEKTAGSSHHRVGHRLPSP